MERVDKILLNPRFIKELERLTEAEKDRAFCGHGIDHLLDVARIAYILNLKSGEKYEKELIYAAALLHDIGRARQYKDGTPHEKESASISAEILRVCDFDEYETALILEAILAHRTSNSDGSGNDNNNGNDSNNNNSNDNNNGNGNDSNNGNGNGRGGGRKGLDLLLYNADKLSRRCFNCGANGICDWEMKNTTLDY